MGEEVSGPSLETEAESLERRKVEALEAIAEALETLTGVVEHLEMLVSVVEPARAAWTDPKGWANPESAREAYIRTGG